MAKVGGYKLKCTLPELSDEFSGNFRIGCTYLKQSGCAWVKNSTYPSIKKKQQHCWVLCADRVFDVEVTKISYPFALCVHVKVKVNFKQSIHRAVTAELSLARLPFIFKNWRLFDVPSATWYQLSNDLRARGQGEERQGRS